MANPETAREGDGAHSNRPENTKFKQQKLDAWQPILTPAWVIGTFIVVGVIFVPVGAYLYKLSNDLFENIVTYDSYDDGELTSGVSSACRIGDINEGYERLASGSATFSDCQLEFTITQDISEDEEVFMYYQISNFYQNHRRYVKSVSDEQLLAEVTINPATTKSDGTLSTACDPSESFANDDFEGRIYYPCGLIALSVFNDGVQLARFERGDTVIDYAAGVPLNDTSNLSITLDTSGIAWDSDLENKYKNPTDASCNEDLNNPGDNLCPLRYLQYQYLWQTYDQFICYPPLADNAQAPDLSQPPSACKTYSTYVNELGNAAYSNWDELTQGQNTSFYGNGCAACEDSTDILVNAGGISPPADTSSATSSGGVRDERFIVWMRTAGLPTFRKLYGHITPPSGGFKEGDKITLSVVPNFLVSTIEGSKAIVLGTTSPLGGKNDVLGIAYLSVGTICLFLAVVFAAKQRFNPRRLGDPSYLAFGNKK